ncbi:TspO/MBR family protein [Novosphingobium piscinae]|uniref:Tryptophan-rich sensory protein n=1 Tax=Novosphingobium piscinae TaxID=1507448 RepID=A0A7X1FXV9_9SPHN|nr:TspO/MBR family protein [Novosphingobium piscinae]MBC2668362.1 tryptophan-rich sensory protein [Novosphingobium piscinae]
MNQLASTGQLRASFLRWALVLVPLVVLLGFVSGRAAQSGPGSPWFDALVKPAIYPPPATFGIVWSVLYVLMGLAAASVGTARGAAGRSLALGLFALQLAVNLAWSPTFFALHQMTAAFWIIVALAVVLAATIVAFWRVRPTAALMLAPYLAWVLFASVLNWQFIQLNPGADGAAAAPAVTRVQL